MATTKEISVSIARTVGLPNYGSMRVEESETVTLEPGDDLNSVQATLHQRVYDRLVNTLSIVLPKTPS